MASDRLRERLTDEAATFADYAAVLVHRVLARHAPQERCGECPPRLARSLDGEQTTEAADA